MSDHQQAVRRNAPTCSSCGANERLYLVTAGIEPGTGTAVEGRVLLYCGGCRRQGPPRIAVHDIAVPIDLVSPELLVKLFALGFTASDPSHVFAMAFPGLRSGHIAAAKRILGERVRSGTK